VKAKIIGISMAAAVAIAMIVVIVYVGPIDISKPQEDDPFKDWNRSGPFAINKHEYKIGENIFISVNGLGPLDVGNMGFILPNGTTTYIAIPFDGSLKPQFNQYFEPGISKARMICSVSDILGEWTVVFQQTEYKPLKFKIINETLPGEEYQFQRVC
jgi:hypothetical protein